MRREGGAGALDSGEVYADLLCLASSDLLNDLEVPSGSDTSARTPTTRRSVGSGMGLFNSRSVSR